LKYFENQWSSQNFHGLWLDYKETEGPLCKFPRIIVVDSVHGSWTSAGVHRESISGLTRARAAARWPGDDGEEMVEEALSASGAWAWREEKESGERCGGERRSSPFI
jgi:hypothetical protein